MVISQTKWFRYCVTLLSCGLSVLPVIHGKVCEGIELRNVTHLANLKDCTEINGELSLMAMSVDNESIYERYALPKLKKISRFLLLYRLNNLRSLGILFPNLRLIRGLELYQENALIIYDLPHLEEIGLSNLLSISQGMVTVQETPQLCYGDKIRWDQLGPAKANIKSSSPMCPSCPERCNGSCWDHQHCQRLTDNCHEECLGCTEPNSSARCDVCRNFEDNRVCVAKCPPGKYKYKWLGKCLTRQECSALNDRPNKTDKRWFVYGDACRDSCPYQMEYKRSVDTCVFCGFDCVKHCSGGMLLNELKIRSLLGCSHIDGSLTITNVTSVEQVETLRANLQALKSIRDYLVVTHNKALESLDFFSRLIEIRGEKLYSAKSLFVVGNRNLTNLWNVKSNFRIPNGTLGFHDNERLCLKNIKEFARKAGIGYSETEVSIYSNGVLCSEYWPVEFTVENLTASTVTLRWNKYDGYTGEYTVYYTDSDDRREAINPCDKSSWITVSTMDSFIYLDDLQAYRLYYYYVDIHLNATETLRSKQGVFRTNRSEPDNVVDLTVKAVSPTEIKLDWKKPQNVGENVYYILHVYREDHDPSITQQRDYCVNPFSESSDATVANEVVYTPEMSKPEETTADQCTSSKPVEWNVEFANKAWAELCGKDAHSKYDRDPCRNYHYEMYDGVETTDGIRVNKRNGKTGPEARRGYYFNEIVNGSVDGNQTYTVKDLNKFTMYVIYVMACNGPVEERDSCDGSKTQTFARTLRRPNADDVPRFDLKVVNDQDLEVTWTEPADPNGFLLAYDVYYKRDLANAREQMLCVTRDKYVQEGRLVLRKLYQGSYSVQLRAISLAGPGNRTETRSIEISSPSGNVTWFIVATAFVLVVLLILLFMFYRLKLKLTVDRIQLIANVNPDYVTVYRPDEWEMERDNVELLKMIGVGTFGRVYLGRIRSKSKFCAVKTVNEEATHEEVTRFLNEACTMKDFTESNHVVKLYGVVSRGQPPLVVMELMARGDLKQYLKYLKEAGNGITSNEIYRMAVEIADGLAYLNYRKYVHRDLAARNCMVSDDKTVKIGDFGMTRDVYVHDYYKKGAGKALLPIRWMAPESIADGMYTSDSDMWSYGVVLWEIVTLAEQPFAGLSNEAVRQYVVAKGTLSRPPDCPNMLWEIMKKCWDWYPSKRPTCFEVIDTLQNHVGMDFQSLSFYHSEAGQSYLMSHGSTRAQNPPALATGGYQYDDSDEETSDETEAATVRITDPEFVPPSSPERTHRPASNLQ